MHPAVAEQLATTITTDRLRAARATHAVHARRAGATRPVRARLATGLAALGHRLAPDAVPALEPVCMPRASRLASC